MSQLVEKVCLIILDSSESPSLFVIHHTKYIVEISSFQSFEWDFLVIDTTKGEELILGFSFLPNFNPYIDWKKGLITCTPYHRDYHDPSKSFSNYFTSSNKCSALVGYSRTPSFPTYVRISTSNSPHSLYYLDKNSSNR
ncbi:hypothetical protein O181_013045 [Austropuccinia psidii MF-1]|uniref:Uncharacterized protein n=1 Tax=Austropuccinia psidii MF-1 TaxID=1389203 RepID=A0A9Q3BY95_9BASI|nr:hypothetical protein [Austropuccinia psidii MF-1]